MIPQLVMRRLIVQARNGHRQYEPRTNERSGLMEPDQAVSLSGPRVFISHS